MLLLNIFKALNFFNNSDCPVGYNCPDEDSTDACMVKHPRYSSLKSVHSGCFLPNEPTVTPTTIPQNCALLCNELMSCKGFAIGKKNPMSSQGGCIFAMAQTDCVKLADKSNSTTAVYPERGESFFGEILDKPNAPSARFGFKGCYKKSKYKEKYLETCIQRTFNE